MMGRTRYRIGGVFADVALGDLPTGWPLITSLPAIVRRALSLSSAPG
jgi:hypothetical protein